ncbi:MAG: NAD(+)/NADH kinase [Actinomycetia bacterium]|nr:NAD(+)/NADH kinase [Actinomycetes bacterium]
MTSTTWEALRPRVAPAPFHRAPIRRTAPPRRVAVVLNPASRRPDVTRHRLTQACAQLGRAALRVWETTLGDPGTGQARAALDWGADTVIAVGGDGTVRLVAGELAGTGIPLGVVPAGSANLYARNLGLRPGPSWRNVRVALAGPLAAADLGQVVCVRDGHPDAVQPMLVVAGLGRDAQAVDQVRHGLKRALGWVAYAEAGVHRVLARGVPMDLRLDDRALHAEAWTVLAANCPRVLDHIVAFPGARLDDGRLEVLRLALANPLQWIPVAAKGVLHFRATPSPLRYDTVERLVARTTRPLPAQIDGDVIPGVTQMTVTVRPGVLRVAVPPRLGGAGGSR